jgi:5,10-methylenetetrahydromethanopterin reductase
MDRNAADRLLWLAEEAGMVRFSYAHIPAYPLDESIRLIRVADELGYYAAYACDETWWKDMWLLFAAAARETNQIRLGPNRGRTSGVRG